jgi:hypothetical protein
MTLEERIKKLMGEFLDLSSIKATNLDHLEELKEELNDLMGQFIEANQVSPRTNEMGGWVEEFRKALPPEGTYSFPNYADTSGEIGASEIEMVKTEIEKVTEDFELEERKANKEGEE